MGTELPKLHCGSSEEPSPVLQLSPPSLVLQHKRLGYNHVLVITGLKPSRNKTFYHPTQITRLDWLLNCIQLKMREFPKGDEIEFAANKPSCPEECF